MATPDQKRAVLKAILRDYPVDEPEVTLENLNDADNWASIQADQSMNGGFFVSTHGTPQDACDYDAAEYGDGWHVHRHVNLNTGEVYHVEAYIEITTGELDDTESYA